MNHEPWMLVIGWVLMVASCCFLVVTVKRLIWPSARYHFENSSVTEQAFREEMAEVMAKMEVRVGPGIETARVKWVDKLQGVFSIDFPKKYTREELMLDLLPWHRCMPFDEAIKKWEDHMPPKRPKSIDVTFKKSVPIKFDFVDNATRDHKISGTWLAVDEADKAWACTSTGSTSTHFVDSEGKQRPDPSPSLSASGHSSTPKPEQPLSAKPKFKVGDWVRFGGGEKWELGCICGHRGTTTFGDNIYQIQFAGIRRTHDESWLASALPRKGEWWRFHPCLRGMVSGKTVGEPGDPFVVRDDWAMDGLMCPLCKHEPVNFGKGNE